MRIFNGCILISLNIYFVLSEEKNETKLMTAVVINNFGWSDVLKVKEVPIPPHTQTEVLVRVKAAGISPVDTYMRAGTFRIKPAFPAILGKEVAGIVEEVGQLVPNYKPGDRVFCCIEMGGYAEYVAVDYKECFPLSNNLSFAQGAALCLTYFSAHRALIIKGCTREDDVVLIHGASGGLGTACVQVAKTAEACVIATVGEFSVGELMKRAGADHVIYHNKHYYLEDAAKLINKTKFDVILDILTSANLQYDKNYLNQYGRIVVFGKHMPVTISEDYIKASSGSVYRISLTQYTKKQQLIASEFILNGVEKGFIQPIIGLEYTLKEAPLAHNDILSSRSATGKLVFIL